MRFLGGTGVVSWCGPRVIEHLEFAHADAHRVRRATQVHNAPHNPVALIELSQLPHLRMRGTPDAGTYRGNARMLVMVDRLLTHEQFSVIRVAVPHVVAVEHGRELEAVEHPAAVHPQLDDAGLHLTRLGVEGRTVLIAQLQGCGPGAPKAGSVPGTADPGVNFLSVVSWTDNR